MDQDMKSACVYPGIAPGTGVDLGLEQREIETLHVAFAAGIAQRLQITGVCHLVLVRDVFRKVLAASATATRRCQRHFSTILAESVDGRAFKRFLYALLDRR